MIEQPKLKAIAIVAGLLIVRAGFGVSMAHLPGECLAAEAMMGRGLDFNAQAAPPATRWNRDAEPIDPAVDWLFAKFDSAQIHADCLWHNYDIIKNIDLSGRFYYGAGGRMKLKGILDGASRPEDDDDTRVGVRVPLGVSYLAQNAPINFYAEVVPFIDIVPDARMGIGLGAGARYCF